MCAHAGESEKTVVRVGFPIQSGISYLDERGEYAGYLVDDLNQRALFTDWEIEYVQVEGDLDTQLSTLMYMLLDGEIDLMGTMNRNAQLVEMFLPPIPPWQSWRATCGGWRRILPTGTTCGWPPIPAMPAGWRRWPSTRR